MSASSSQVLAAAAAEKVRVALRLLEEVAQLMSVGEVPSDSNSRAAAQMAAAETAALFGMLATFAGEEYVRSLQEPADKLQRALWTLAGIQNAAAQMDGQELRQLAERPDFAYRDVARLAIEIRIVLGFDRPTGRAVPA